jgi:hypothetical protein
MCGFAELKEASPGAAALFPSGFVAPQSKVSTFSFVAPHLMKK